MKVIFVTGYWKSGTTLLQFLLAKDKNIQNVFPREGINYDGTEFWRKYIPQHTSNNGHYIPKRVVENIDTDTIRGWINKFHDGSDCILLKRPQFVMNDELIYKLWPNASIISTKRDLLPNIYSMLRMRELNRYPDDLIVGQYIPGWRKMKGKSPIELLVHQYCYINNYIDKHNIFNINYNELCNNTEKVLKDISKEIGYDINLEIPDITSCDIDYIEGTSLKSRNDDTATGKIEIKRNDKEFPPLTKEEIDLIHHYYDKYKGVNVI